MDQKFAQLLKETGEKFSSRDKKGNVFAGFDGFIDNILKPVRSRSAKQKWEAIDNISEFAERIASGAGKSTNIEMVKIRTSFGGNGPLMSGSLAELGNSVKYVGALGYPDILEHFKDFASRCEEAVTVSEPGITDAFEMNDGKIMFNYPGSILELSWETIEKNTGKDKLEDMISGSEYFAFVNWTMIPSMNTIFEEITDIFSRTPLKRTVYIDLTDPKKRSQSDLKECTERLMQMNIYADVILGLNGSEAEQIADITGAGGKEDDIKILAAKIQNAMNIKAVVIHTIKQAACSLNEGSFLVDGPYTPEPVISTGAGDIFNAGFYAGYINGLTPEECLITGTANSGYYVRQGKTADKKELIKFISLWSKKAYNEFT